jgi:hypothetical protein
VSVSVSSALLIAGFLLSAPTAGLLALKSRTAGASRGVVTWPAEGSQGKREAALKDLALGDVVVVIVLLVGAVLLLTGALLKVSGI